MNPSTPVSLLLELHSRLDTAVADAYGWLPGLSQQDILKQLMALNTLRVQKEQAGLMRYLRP